MGDDGGAHSGETVAVDDEAFVEVDDLARLDQEAQHLEGLRVGGEVFLLGRVEPVGDQGVADSGCGGFEPGCQPRAVVVVAHDRALADEPVVRQFVEEGVEQAALARHAAHGFAQGLERQAGFLGLPAVVGENGVGGGPLGLLPPRAVQEAAAGGRDPSGFLELAHRRLTGRIGEDRVAQRFLGRDHAVALELAEQEGGRIAGGQGRAPHLQHQLVGRPQEREGRGRERVEHHGSRQRVVLACVPQQQAVAGEDEQRFLQPQARETGCARFQHTVPGEQEAGLHQGAGMVDGHPLAVAEWRWHGQLRVGAAAAGQFDIDHGGGAAEARQGHDLAAPGPGLAPLGQARVAEVHRRAHPGLGLLHAAVVVLQGTDIRRDTLGHQHDRLAADQRAAGERARDHGADAFGREGAVAGEAGFAAVGLGRGGGEPVGQGGAQFVEALAARRAHRDHGGTLEHRPAQFLADALGGERRVVGQIGLGQGHHPVAHAEVLEDLEVFLGLGHPAVVRGDDQQGRVDAHRAGHHLADEIGVPRHIDHPDLQHPAAGVAQDQPGEAERDRHAARLLLGQAVGIGARQRLDEAGLAVVDVAGGAEDEVGHGVAGASPVPGRPARADGNRRGWFGDRQQAIVGLTCRF